MIPVAPPAPQHRPDVAVDRFDFPEGDLLVAVVQDTVQRLHQQPGELLDGAQPLPLQNEEPLGEEAARRALVGVTRELSQTVPSAGRLWATDDHAARDGVPAAAHGSGGPGERLLLGQRHVRGQCQKSQGQVEHARARFMMGKPPSQPVGLGAELPAAEAVERQGPDVHSRITVSAARLASAAGSAQVGARRGPS